jgi:hypothetical protein
LGSIQTRGFFILRAMRALKSGFVCWEAHEIGLFYCVSGAEKEGNNMQITPTQSVKQAERMVSFLFTVAQVALVLSLFWVLRTHLV